MSTEKSGVIADTGIGYKVGVDDSLSLYAQVNVPIPVLADMLVQKLHSPVASEIEQGVVAALKLYIAAQKPAQP